METRANYKRVMPQETRDKISKTMSGRRLSQFTKDKIGQSVKKRWDEVPLTTSTSNSKNNE